MAGNSYEGCGHRHKSAKAAEPCAERLNLHYTRFGRHWLKAKIYRITGTGRKDHELVGKEFVS